MKICRDFSDGGALRNRTKRDKVEGMEKFDSQSATVEARWKMVRGRMREKPVHHSIFQEGENVNDPTRLSHTHFSRGNKILDCSEMKFKSFQ